MLPPFTNQYTGDGGWNPEYRQKFKEKLRQYFHEEVLKREIASIETLLGLLSDQDLKKGLCRKPVMDSIG